MNYQNFNSQPHKEADESKLKYPATRRHFNSQPHKEADETYKNGAKVQEISTHSLTRRLTTCTGMSENHKGISTHSLTRRLTDLVSLIPFSRMYFNSQPHKEADGRYSRYLTAILYFNSQPHKEADDTGEYYEYDRKEFQLTASQGG